MPTPASARYDRLRRGEGRLVLAALGLKPESDASELLLEGLPKIDCVARCFR